MTTAGDFNPLPQPLPSIIQTDPQQGNRRREGAELSVEQMWNPPAMHNRRPQDTVQTRAPGGHTTSLAGFKTNPFEHCFQTKTMKPGVSYKKNTGNYTGRGSATRCYNQCVMEEIQDAIKRHLKTNGKENITKTVAEPKLF